jgi:hypothetical protein
MELKEKEQIYNRLSEISLSIESKNIPDIRYINEKIWKCHILIEEVEKFYITINREISVTQRALNDEMAAYENSRDTLISTDMEIKALPSQKDRESHANMKLKDELHSIKKLKNECVDLENLQKVINLKLKNLTRLNTDIKIQLKLMDSQMRLGQPDINNSATKSLMEEMAKSKLNEDVFKNADTEVEEQTIIDPTSPIDMDELLGNTVNDEPIQESAIKEFEDYPLNGLYCSECGSEQRETYGGACCINGHGGSEGVEMVVETQQSTTDQVINMDDIIGDVINDEPIQEEEELQTIYPEDDLSSCMSDNQITEEVLTQGIIDLDKVFNEKTIETQVTEDPCMGHITKEIVTQVTEVEIPKSENLSIQESKPSDEMDLDSLLSQFN